MSGVSLCGLGLDWEVSKQLELRGCFSGFPQAVPTNGPVVGCEKRMSERTGQHSDHPSFAICVIIEISGIWIIFPDAIS